MKIKHLSLCTLLGMLLLPQVQAAAPANDHFADATLITGTSGSIAGNSTDATTEMGEPAEGEFSLWYKWIIPESGHFTLHTRSGYHVNPKLSVFTGTTLDDLQLEAFNNDINASNLQGRIDLEGEAGTTLWIRVGCNIDWWYWWEPGAFKLVWEMPEVPANDDFANATPLTGAAGTATVSSTLATWEEGEVGETRSVWYQWTAPATGIVQMDTFDGEKNTELHIITNDSTLDAMEVLDYNDDAQDSVYGESLVRLNVTAGTVYRIRVCDHNSNGWPGNITLDWMMVYRLANDDFADAALLTGSSGSVTGQTFDATLEDYERYWGQGDTRSVWYEWTAPFTGLASFDQAGSGTRTSIQVATSGTLEALNIIAINLNPPHQVVVPVTLGQTYRIRMATFNPGRFTLNWKQDDEANQPTVISLDAASYTAAEGGPDVDVTVSRIPGSVEQNSYVANLRVEHGSADEDDFGYLSIAVYFEPGVLTQTFSIPIHQDTRFEGAETFRVFLDHPQPDVVLDISNALVTIIDDEPFLPMAARYAGIIQGASLDSAMTGRINIHATSKGSFTGRLQMGIPAPAAFRGSFDESGQATVTIPSRTRGDVTLKLYHMDNGDRIRVMVTLAEKTVEASVRRASPPSLEKEDYKRSTYTSRIAHLENLEGDVPKADGFLSISVSSRGVARIIGTLADNTSVTASSLTTLHPHDSNQRTIPIFIPLYKGKGGLVSDMENHSRYITQTELRWYKAAMPAAKVFKGGFNLSTSLETGPYTRDKGKSILSRYSENSVFWCRFMGPNFGEEGLSQAFRLQDNNQVALQPNPAVKMKLKFLPATGIFIGRFQAGGAKSVPFKGAVFQTTYGASGFFLVPVGTGKEAVLTSGRIDIFPYDYGF